MVWRPNRLHISWLIGWLCLGFVVGVFAAKFAPGWLFGLANSFWMVAVSLVVALSLLRYRWCLVLLFICGGVLGVYKASFLIHDLQAYQPYYGHTLAISGTVAQDTSYSEKGEQRISLNTISIDGQALAGEVWASAGKADIKRGDQIKIRGQLDAGFGTMAATMYRAEIVEIVRPNPGDVARRVRDWFGAGVRVAIPEPGASLGLGYLVGQRSALSPELEEAIKTVGLSHVVVASGYNLTILVTFARRLFVNYSKYLATLFSVIMILGFMLVTGFSPSMSRAGLVAMLSLLVWYYGRGMHPFVMLSFAAAVTVFIKPSYAWGDLGWSLSFTSFVGVIVLAPLLHHYFWGLENKPSLVRGLLVETSSAQMLTTPLILGTFGLLSVYSLPANMLVLPFVPFAMLCTFIAGVAGLAVSSYADLVGLPAHVLLTYSIKVITTFADLPFARSEQMLNLPLMIVSYIGLACLVVFLKRRTKHDFRNTKYDPFD